MARQDGSGTAARGGFLRLTGIEKHFGTVKVINGVDIEAAEGEFVVFVGPSGCGKSTLLRMIAGLEDVSVGDVYIDGARVTDLEPAKRQVSMVFQSYALFPAHERARQHRLRPQDVEGAQARDRQAGGRGRAHPADGAFARPQAASAFRRPAPARGDRPGDRASSRSCSCSTSRCRTSTPNYARRCGSRSRGCTASSASP